MLLVKFVLLFVDIPDKKKVQIVRLKWADCITTESKPDISIAIVE